MPPEIKQLKSLGYICNQLKPAQYRVRGPQGFVTIWPVDRFFKGEYERKASRCDDVVLAVTSALAPYDLPTPEEKAATHEWRDRLDCLLYVIHSKTIATI